MAQLVKVLATQAQQTEFEPQNPHKSGRRGWSPLTSVNTPQHAPPTGTLN